MSTRPVSPEAHQDHNAKRIRRDDQAHKQALIHNAANEVFNAVGEEQKAKENQPEQKRIYAQRHVEAALGELLNIAYGLK